MRATGGGVIPEGQGSKSFNLGSSSPFNLQL